MSSESTFSDPIDPIIDRLSRAKRVLITTHVRPDGDALGSTAALQLGLRAKGIAAEVMLLSALPEKYAFLYRDHDVTFVVPESPLPLEWLTQFDALLIVDTGTFSQLPGLEAARATWTVPTFIIDHHRTQEPWGDLRWADTKAAAACEMVERLLSRWQVPFTPAIATCLFTGIATDTGWLQYSSTTAATMRTCATLVEAGVDTDKLQQRIYQSERPERLLLQQRVMGSLRFDADGRIATMIVRLADFAATGADKSDTEALVNVPLQVAKVVVSALFTEDKNGEPVRISFRGKGSIDLAKFCEPHGGGGHARAAGARIAGEVAEVRDRVAMEMAKAIEDIK